MGVGEIKRAQGTSPGCWVPNIIPEDTHTGAIYEPNRLFLGNVYLGIRYEEQENCSWMLLFMFPL